MAEHVRNPWSGQAMRANRIGVRGEAFLLKKVGDRLVRGSLARKIPGTEEELRKLLTNDFEFSEEIAEGILIKLLGEENEGD